MTCSQAVALLTEADEKQLARAIEAGVLAEHLLVTGECPIPAQPDELAALVEQGRQAWTRFWTANLRLVQKLALENARHSGLRTEELFQEGCVALARAIQRFDFRRGRFSTYAMWWVGQHLSDVASTRFGELALPPTRASQHRRVWATATRLKHQMSGEALVDQIVAELGYPPRTVRELLAYRAPVAVDLNDQAWQFARQETDFDRRIYLSQIRRLLARVASDEAMVLRMRFGIACEPATAVQLAERLELSACTVRRLERRGLARMRALIESQDSSGFDVTLTRPG